MFMWITGNGAGHIQCGYTNDTARHNLVLQELGANVGIGAKEPSYKLDVSGNIRASGSVTQNSDIRLKTNITSLKYRGTLNPVTFVKDGEKQIGFIAQEVQELYPELVFVDNSEEHYLSIDYSRITAILQAQLIQHEDELTTLKNRVQVLEDKLSQYESIN